MTLVPTNLTSWACYTAHYFDYGYGAAPVAGPAGSALEIFAEHAPWCMKVVTWVAQAIGAIPACPDPNTGSTNEVLTHKAISAPIPGTLPDGSQVWTVAGCYKYLLRVPPSDSDNLIIGSGPFDTAGALQTVLSPTAFLTSLIGPVPGVTQGTYGGQPGGGAGLSGTTILT